MKVLKIRDLVERIDRKKAELGLPETGYVLPNSGANRSREKRDLLQWIEGNAARNGRVPAFREKD